MRRPQWIAAGIASLLLVLTYVGCPVRPPELEDGFNRGPLEATGLESLIRESRADLTPRQIATLSTLEDRLESQTEDSARVDIMEQMAGEWYRADKPAISGVYATRIAELTNDENAWAIAGTTFSLCVQQTIEDNKTRQFCSSQAERAYQSAISLSPENAEHRINLALTYTDNPSADNPMKGILMLRDLEKQFPENARVYITLAQLAIKTNQLEKAAERLQTAVNLEPENPDAVCPLAKVYENLGRAGEADIYARKCSALIGGS